jgi:pSer/pThr/pTyr-binding forkhead associated (FHA) protein
MNAFLIINTQVFPIPDTPITIGRNLSNQLVVSVSTVSRKHAMIQRKGDHYVLTDLNSTGGTFVNEKKIMKAVLKSGDSILLADTPLVFVENAPHLADRAEDATGRIKKKGKKSTTRPTNVTPNYTWRPKK